MVHVHDEPDHSVPEDERHHEGDQQQPGHGLAVDVATQTTPPIQARPAISASAQSREDRPALGMCRWLGKNIRSHQISTR